MRSRIFTRLFVVLMVLLSLATAAPAATYYVATCGSDGWAGVNVNCIAPLGPKRTIQAAINAAVNGDTVIVMPGIYVGQIDLDGKAITLIGAAGAGSTFIDGGGAGPVVTCNSLEGPATVIEGFTIQNGHAAGNGGGMFMALASPTINDCLFKNNSGDWGGGLYAITSSPSLDGCTFTDNTASVHGGGAAFKFGNPTLNECEFSFNAAQLWGGGLLLDDTAAATVTGGVFTGNASVVGAGLLAKSGSASINTVLFANNVASVHGGGLEFQFMTAAAVDGCDFAGNSVTVGGGGEGGGAMWIAATAATISNCDFNTNTAPFGGGAVYCNVANGTTFTACTFTANENTGCCGASAVHSESSTLSFVGCSFTGNEVSQYGGAIMADASNLTLIFCGFHDNLAPDWIAYGAALYMTDSTLQAGLSTFTGNQAGGGTGGGGGAVFGWNSSASFEGCTLQGNSTPGDGGGGAIRMESGSTLALESCTLTDNSAGTGGAVFLKDMNGVGFVDTTFDGNDATDHGGAVYLEGGAMAVQDSEFNNNNAGNAGGGLFTASLLITPNSQQPLHMRNVQFSGNHADVAGGGLCAGTPTKAVGCAFLGNTAQDGGGVIGVGSFAEMEFHSSRFDANQAAGVGGALMVGAMTSGSSATLVNSIVSNNTTPFGGGAIYETALGGHLEIINCAVVDNDGGGITIANGATTSAIANTVLWGNAAGDDLDGLMPEVMYCNIQDGGMGIAPMSVDPMFINAATGNYHLSPGSPCIDSGKNWAVPLDALDLDGDGDTSELIPEDFDGQPRFADDLGAMGGGCGGLAIVDIGPYEAAGEPVPAMYPGDVNGDGLVNVMDLLDLLAMWGACPGGCCTADFDQDGMVTVVDLLALLKNWS